MAGFGSDAVLVLSLALSLVVAHELCRAPRNNFMHGRDVALPAVPDGEPTVFGLPSETVFENHHRRDHVIALQIRNIKTFDTQRSLVEAQRMLQLFQRLAPRGQVAGTPQF